MSKRKRHGGSRANRGTPSKCSRVFGHGDDNNRWASCTIDPWVKVGAQVERRDGSCLGTIRIVGWSRGWHGFSCRHPAVFVRYAATSDSNGGSMGLGGCSTLPLTLREFYRAFKEHRPLSSAPPMLTLTEHL